MAVPSPSKQVLRTAARAKRRSYSDSLTPDARAELEHRLAEIVAPRLAGATAIGLYYPLKAEISPLTLVPYLAARTIGFPWFADRDALMMFREAPAESPGPWGVLQPTPGAAPVAPEAVIVPLVLADRAGTRIGHGKGHYDRALANLRASRGAVRTIGVGWDWQIVDAPITADPWDIPLDALATPGRWIDCA